MAAERTISICPEILLGKEWQRQSQQFIELGFHREMSLTEKDYLSSLPRFTSQPESFKGRFYAPVIVETRVPIKRQCELVGIIYSLGGLLDQKDCPYDPKDYKTPDFPYTVWLDEGARKMNREAHDVRRELAYDERGGTIFDGLANYIANPRILQIRSLDLPGTAVGSVYVANLHLRDDGDGPPHPILGFSCAVNALPKFGSLVCGRQK